MTESAWDKAEREADEASKGSGKYVKLEDDGDKVIGAFCGDPHTRELYWDPAKKHYEDYTAEHKKQGKNSSFRASLNIFVFAEGNGENVNQLNPPQMKIIEGGVKWFKAILKNKKKFGLDSKVFEIERNGKKNDSKTTYSILPERDLTDEEKKSLRGLDLHDLAEASGGPSDSGGDSDFESYDKAKGGGNPDDPIESADADEITGRLRKLPREDIDKFTSKFGIKRIKELKRKDLDEAKAYVTELEKPAEGGGDDEVDPFA